MMRSAIFLALSAVLGSLASPVQAGVIETVTTALPSGAGGSGGNTYANTTDMIVSGNRGSGTGAVGLQGPTSFNPLIAAPSHPAAANLALKFIPDSAAFNISALNNQYGVGGWTIANPQLKMQVTYYANNTSFGGGAGAFDVYWVGNDHWSVDGAVKDSNNVPMPNPPYVTSGSALQSWSGTQSLLDPAGGPFQYAWAPNPLTGSAGWVTDKTGSNQTRLTYNLAADSAFINDLASGGPASLYLMPTSTSPNLGMCIFTGGSSSSWDPVLQAYGITPTLTFDVVSVPEPASWALLGIGSLCLLLWRRRSVRT
jgi:hypothetical protein